MNIVPFESAVPSLREVSPFKPTLDGVSKGGVSFPTVSYKGKSWTLHRGDDATLLCKPDDPDTPASYIDAIIIGVAPAQGVNARTFYAEGYVEGSNDKPDCRSINGVSPDEDVESPQCSACAKCPQNVTGSGATQQNPKAKACKSHKRLAIVAADSPKDPMLLRVPGESLPTLGEYNKMLFNKGFAFAEVLTRIGFDHTKAHPSLVFKPVGVVKDPKVLAVLFEASKMEVTQQILGNEAEPSDAPAAIEAPKEEAQAPAAPPTAKKAETKKEPKPAEEKPKARPTVTQPVVVDAESGMGDVLDGLEFD